MTSKSPEQVAAAISPQVEADRQPEQPGVEANMDVKPIFIRESYKGSGKLQGKVAIITGGWHAAASTVNTRACMFWSWLLEQLPLHPRRW